jgi:hypothetical protein
VCRHALPPPARAIEALHYIAFYILLRIVLFCCIKLKGSSNAATATTAPMRRLQQQMPQATCLVAAVLLQQTKGQLQCGDCALVSYCTLTKMQGLQGFEAGLCT